MHMGYTNNVAQYSSVLMILNGDNRGIIFLSLLQLTQRSFQFLLTESCTR